MARVEDRLSENAPGDLFVDASCIDCDACRQIAPAVFGRSRLAEQSIVVRQPAGAEERRRAAMALVTCPTSSIGSASKAGVRAAAAAFPEPVAPGVHYCGYASESSYGASSYLLERPEGNVLVDSPRAAPPLLARLAELGGARTMFLTHRDDVADHERFRAALGCERVMMRADVTAATAAIERQLEGDEPVALGPDLLVIPLPGHTRGSAALLAGDEYLFTGDHLWWSAELGALHASRAVCWHSWQAQTRSMERLLDHRFEWVLPGHGRRWQAPSAAAMRAEIERLVRRMQAS